MSCLASSSLVLSSPPRRLTGRPLQADGHGDFTCFAQLGQEGGYPPHVLEGRRVRFLAPFWPGAARVPPERLEYWSRTEADKADGLMLVYSIADRHCFDQHLPTHFQWAQKSARAKPGRRTVLVATRAGEEESESNRIVSRREGEAFAKFHGIPFFEVSAQLNVNVHEAFAALLSPEEAKDAKCTLQ